jgi:hypothetical protein
MNLGFRKNFAGEVDWPLHIKSMAFFLVLHHDFRADDVGSRSDVE